MTAPEPHDSRHPILASNDALVSRAVLAGAAIYTAVLAALTWARFEAFLSESDLAVFTQLTWLMGRADSPFSSITLRPMLADHWEPALALLAPLGTVGVPAVGLLVVQAATLAAVAVGLLALARRLGATGWVAAIVPLLWLVSPVVTRANLWDFHPDALIAALLVATVLGVLGGQWALAAAAVLVGCSLKEDAGLTFAALGVALAWNGHRRPGAILAAAAAAWAVVLNGVILPLAWPATREHYTDRFVGERGGGLGDVVRFWVTHPLDTLSETASLTNAGIVLALVATTGGLCVLAPRWLVAAAPAVAANLLSAYEGQHTLRYQYWLVPAAAVAIAGAAGAARVGARRERHVLVAALATGVVLGALSLVAFGRLVGDMRDEWPARAERRAIVAAVPAGASVSAPLRFLAHFAERHDLYTFPVPFAAEAPESEWSPEQIAAARGGLGYVVFDPTLTRDPEALAHVERLGFRPVLRAGTATLYRSERAP